jgi:hypothetical protein
VALLLAVGVVACGGGDEADSTATEAVGQQSQTDNASQGGENRTSNADDSDSGGGSQSGGDASDFVPRKHSDSGGGAEQFKVRGGDNSVQEFGEEADSRELDEAAVALHNFLDARAEGNWAAACQYMASATIESLEQVATRTKQNDASCGEILEGLTNPAAAQSLKEEAAKANVGSLRIEDEQAFVIYTGIAGTIMAMPMANEDGDWKVTSLAGTPLS